MFRPVVPQVLRASLIIIAATVDARARQARQWQQSALPDLIRRGEMRRTVNALVLARTTGFQAHGQSGNDDGYERANPEDQEGVAIGIRRVVKELECPAPPVERVIDSSEQWRAQCGMIGQPVGHKLCADGAGAYQNERHVRSEEHTSE